MKIAFMDRIGWDYQVESAYHIPLGGSQSALCYLAESLSRKGHEVFLLNNTLKKVISRGVTCLPFRRIPMQLLHSLDFLIEFYSTGLGNQLKDKLDKKTRLMLWTQHAHDQSIMEPLQNPSVQNIYDGIILASEWQRHQFQQHFNIDPSTTAVLRNAIAPAFCGLFPDDAPVLTQKSQPPVIAYTSTPFRGLDILLDVFPEIRRRVPGTELKVFSSMKVYNMSKTEDKFRHLYQRCRETEGVIYFGSVPQPDLARQLRTVTVLAYPNTFPETSCIAVMEAMASGCMIVTSCLGALPETTAGYARLVQVEVSREAYMTRFIKETVQALRECAPTDNTAAETHLKKQVSYVNKFCNWSVISKEWVEWLVSKRG